jgi:putative FmdB family regulatory protein
MPTYEYECDTCGLVFEEFQSMSAAPLTKCKKEGCPGKVKRLFSPGAGFIFKGSGFYQTDYRSDSYKKAAAADKPSSDSSSKATETKTTGTTAETKSSGAKPPPQTSATGSSSK